MDLIDRLPLAKREEVRRRRQALLHIFSFLDTNTLGRVSEVCREWKLVSRNSGLWKRVELKNDRISSKYLSTISRWCKQLKHLILEGEQQQQQQYPKQQQQKQYPEQQQQQYPHIPEQQQQQQHSCLLIFRTPIRHNYKAVKHVRRALMHILEQTGVSAATAATAVATTAADNWKIIPWFEKYPVALTHPEHLVVAVAVAAAQVYEDIAAAAAQVYEDIAAAAAQVYEDIAAAAAAHDLKPRNRRRNESVEDYVDSTRACLEQGLEQLLKRSEASLVSLSIINCGHQLTSKSLWAASCYSRMLLHVTYMSDVDPIGPEVMWALGSGCRDLKTLIVPPLFPCQKPGVFNTKCVNLIGRCFQDLEVLCIGGLDVETSSLIVIGKCCQRLQSLEMNHMKEVTTETAKGMCDVGLKMLKILDFVHTPVDPGVVNIFYDTCKHLKRIKIQMGLKDFANGRECKVDVEEYETAVEKLADLKVKPGLGNILRFKAQPGVKLVN